MKLFKSVIVVLLFIGLTSLAFASHYIFYSDAELVFYSDLVVSGVIKEEKGQMFLQVSNVLKGAELKLIPVEVTYFKNDDVLMRKGDKGIFFLKQNGVKYQPFHPDGYKDMSCEAYIIDVVNMFENPRPYLDIKKFPENIDIIFVLGEIFSKWEIKSKEIPTLGKHMERYYIKFYEEDLWDEKKIVTLNCKVNEGSNSTVRVISSEPEGALSELFKFRLLMVSKWIEVKSELKPQFSVTLDTRQPTQIGTLPYEDAVSYLRERLKSTDPQIVMSATLSLAKMRDVNSVPYVTSLLTHKDKRIQVRAIEFLGWSGDKRVVKTLCELLDAEASHYTEGSSISADCASALVNIDDPAVLPCLERAAARGAYSAMELVGKIGETESFNRMLKALEADPNKCAWIDFTLSWLVRRSNKNFESWMHNAVWDKNIGISKIPRWRTWWDANKNDFKIIKSPREVVLEEYYIAR